MGTYGWHGWALIGGHIWMAPMGGIAGYHSFKVFHNGASVHLWILIGTYLASICICGWPCGMYLAIHMLGASLVVLEASLVVLEASLVVQCGHPWGGYADKQSAYTAPVRRAADRLSSRLSDASEE